MNSFDINRLLRATASGEVEALSPSELSVMRLYCRRFSTTIGGRLILTRSLLVSCPRYPACSQTPADTAYIAIE